MKLSNLVLFLCIIFSAQQVWAGDYYNKNAGFGFWYPASWSTKENGRSASTTGGEYSTEMSEIFIGSDWITAAQNLDGLKVYLEKNYDAGTKIEKISFAALDGFRIGNANKGELYLLREPQNVMYIEYSLEGSGYKFEQAQAVLNSIYIRTDPYENHTDH